MTTSPETRAERARRVSEARHSGEMEGFTVDADTKHDSDDYVAGVIDSDELVRRARARYGLPESA
jgi:hypothetical protein